MLNQKNEVLKSCKTDVLKKIIREEGMDGTLNLLSQAEKEIKEDKGLFIPLIRKITKDGEIELHPMAMVNDFEKSEIIYFRSREEAEFFMKNTQGILSDKILLKEIEEYHLNMIIGYLQKYKNEIFLFIERTFSNSYKLDDFSKNSLYVNIMRNNYGYFITEDLKQMKRSSENFVSFNK